MSGKHSSTNKSALYAGNNFVIFSVGLVIVLSFLCVWFFHNSSQSVSALTADNMTVSVDRFIGDSAKSVLDELHDTGYYRIYYTSINGNYDNSFLVCDMVVDSNEESTTNITLDLARNC